MRNEQTERDEGFTEAHRLKLLQLQTRQEIHKRLAPVHLEEVEDDSEHQTVIPKKWHLIPEAVNLYEWQRECLPKWLEKGRGTVKVATGGGKTLFAFAAIEKLQNDHVNDLRVAVIVPTIPLMNQWRDELRQSNLPDSAIALLGGGNTPVSLKDARIVLCVLASARTKLANLVKTADEDDWRTNLLLIVDECHRSSAAIARNIFKANARYTLGLSATPEQEFESAEDNRKTDSLDRGYNLSTLGEKLGPIIYELTINDAFKAGLLASFEIWHVGLSLKPREKLRYDDLSRKITDLRKKLELIYRKSGSRQSFIPWIQTQASRGDLWVGDASQFIGLTGDRKRLLYAAEARRDLTLAILGDTDASNPNQRSIVFHESISEIECLFIQAIEQDITAVLEHSGLPSKLREQNIEAFRQGVAKSIISAKSLVEGFNVPSADLGIIVASSGSVRQRIQSLGRMLRRKTGERDARIYIFYIQNTTDENIYEKADWEDVIGAERNKYFIWQAPNQGDNWKSGLSEQIEPPRTYKLPPSKIDGSNLQCGDVYSARPDGEELKVDQERNLRTIGNEDSLIPAEREMINAVINLNPQYRRARLTLPGHLIVRTDDGGSKEQEWRYLGQLNTSTKAAQSESGKENRIKLSIKSRSGKTVICQKVQRNERYALGPENGGSIDAGKTRDRLLSWVRDVETKEKFKLRNLYWDGKVTYWLEIWSDCVMYSNPVSPLEFRE